MTRRNSVALLALLLVVSLSAAAVPFASANAGGPTDGAAASVQTAGTAAGVQTAGTGAGVQTASANTGPQSHAQTGTTVDCSFPFTARDATGTNVTVEERPERIVVLQASAAQTVWELGAEDRVVGAPVASYTDYLEGIDGKTDVLNADEYTVNQEAVVDQEADLVLAPNVVVNETVESLRAANQTVFRFGLGTSLEFVANKTALTGHLVGSCGAAEETNEEYWNRVESVENGTDEYESPRVLHFSDNFTAGSGTFIGELITTAGGVNVAAENGVTGYGPLNAEAVVEWNPEVVLVADDGGGVPSTAAYESTFAVQNDQVVAVNGNYLSQPAPRVVVALEQMADAFAEADLESTESPSDAGTESDGAGFGVGAAVAALLAVVLLSSRRP